MYERVAPFNTHTHTYRKMYSIFVVYSRKQDEELYVRYSNTYMFLDTSPQVLAKFNPDIHIDVVRILGRILRLDR